MNRFISTLIVVECALISEWSKALPLTANCLLQSRQGYARKSPVTRVRRRIWSNTLISSTTYDRLVTTKPYSNVAKK